MRNATPNLEHYFERIGFHDTATVKFETLVSVHEAHVLAIPFENIDVQLGRPLTTNVTDAFRKIVHLRRGGWCYEQNGLLGWALSEIGFDVTRIAAAVMRQNSGKKSAASHLCLIVRVPGSDTKYLADVGFGGSMLTPISLVENRYRQAPFDIRLTRTDDGFWRFSESNTDGEFGYDFIELAANEDALSQKSEFQRSHPSSSFVLNLVAQRRSRDKHRVLRGRVLSTTMTDSCETILLNSGEELVTVLREVFRLDIPEVARLWPKIEARHEALFDDRAP